MPTDAEYNARFRKREYMARQRATPEGRAKLNHRNRVYFLRRKQRVINHYGGKCRCCGVEDLVFLTIHHPEGDGAEHRKAIGAGRNGGRSIYAWLERAGYPDGFEVLCFNCNFAESQEGGCPHRPDPKPRPLTEW